MTTNPFNYASQNVIKHGGYEIEPYIKKNGKVVNRYQILNKNHPSKEG